MLTIRFTNNFKKDLKKIDKRGLKRKKLDVVVRKLANEEPLPPKYRDHALSGNYEGFRECHIAPDWLLIYTIKRGELILVLSRTGTHSDLF